MKCVKPKSKKRSNYALSLPTDFPWKALKALVEVNVHHLTDAESARIFGTIRARDLNEIFAIADDWSPQCMASSDISVARLHAMYQVSAYLKKYPFAGNSEPRKKRTLDGFLKSELACSDYNQSGYRVLESLENSKLSQEALPLMRNFLQRLLGDVVPLEEILKDARHGPGSSLCTKKGRVTAYYKYSDLPYSVTRGARPYAINLIENDERWIGALMDDYRTSNGILMHMPVSMSDFWDSIFQEVEGNSIIFIPKDARKERAIAIEPRANLMVQLGVDGYIRKALKSYGCNLDSQTKNQMFAYLGSTPADRRRFSTIDLAAASDTISMKVCQMLLPAEWYGLLCDLRSPEGVIQGYDDTVKYSKISSMGNGFTFALESALFLAAAYAATTIANPSWTIRDDVAVYGDDIIVPADSALCLIEILNACGFQVNQEKSYILGLFKESCGTDYFKGVNVRPIYLTGEVVHVKELFSIINRSAYIHSQKDFENCVDFNYTELSALFLKWLPDKYKNFIGPPSTEEFDTYLHAPVSIARQLGIKTTRSVMRYRRLVTRPIEKKGNKFLFRKLMAPLNSATRLTPNWEQKPWDTASNGGNIFTVTERNALMVGVSDSYTSNWYENYSHVAHIKPLIKAPTRLGLAFFKGFSG